MSTLRFHAAEVKRVVEHSLAAREQGKVLVDYADRAGIPTARYRHVQSPAVLLVHDQGVYLMSNGLPRDLIQGTQETGSNFVAYAVGCHPDTDDAWWETSRQLVGGDDFSETIEAAREILDLINDGYADIVFTVTARRISFAGGRHTPTTTPLTKPLDPSSV